MQISPFNVFDGEGYGCVPLQEVPLNATGRGADHSTARITDDEGKCGLQLQYDKTYQVRIQKNDYESALFDVIVIDDQVFLFHMKELEISSQSHSLAQMMLQRIILPKTFITSVEL